MRIKNQESMQTIVESNNDHQNHSIINKSNDDQPYHHHHPNDLMMKIKNAVNDHYKSSPLLISNNLPVAIESHETPLSLPRWTIELPLIHHHDYQEQGPLTERNDKKYNFNYRSNNNNYYYNQIHQLSEANQLPNTTPTPYRKIDQQTNQKQQINQKHSHHQQHQQPPQQKQYGDDQPKIVLPHIEDPSKLSSEHIIGSQVPNSLPFDQQQPEKQHTNDNLSKTTIHYEQITNNTITNDKSDHHRIAAKPNKHHPLPPIEAPAAALVPPPSSDELFHQSPAALCLFCNLLSGGFYCHANFSSYSDNNDYPLIIVRLIDHLSLQLIDAKKHRSWTNNDIPLKNIKKIVEMKSNVLCLIIQEDDDPNQTTIINYHHASIFLEFPSPYDRDHWQTILSSLIEAINTPSLYNILSGSMDYSSNNNTINHSTNNHCPVTNNGINHSSSKSVSLLALFHDYSNRFVSSIKKPDEKQSDPPSLAICSVQSIREKLIKLSTMGAEREEEQPDQTPLSVSGNVSNNNDSYNNSKSISNYNNNNNNNDKNLNSPSVFDTPVLMVPLSSCTDSCLHATDVQCGNITNQCALHHQHDSSDSASNNRLSDDDSYDAHILPCHLPYESNTAINPHSSYTNQHNNYYHYSSNPLPLSAPPLRPLHRSVSFHPSASILRSQIASMHNKLLSLEKEWTRIKKDRTRLTGDSDYKIFYLKSRIKEISAQNHELKKIAVKKRMEEARKLSNYL